jgi:hypothetical protein
MPTPRRRSTRIALLTLSLSACASTPGKVAPAAPAPPPVAREDAARAALGSFVDAAEQGDFTRAYALLAGPLRARYTPERLESDFRAEPLAKERLARARAALANAPLLDAGGARFPIGDGRAVRLVLEDGAFRVASLE